MATFMCAQMVDLTPTQLHEILDYDAGTGVFTWRVARSNRVKVGCAAGRRNDQGYIIISLSGRDYRAHRLAWLYVYGEWPPQEIDHINGIRDDNRIVNLRLATHAQNGANRRSHRDGASGVKGVSWSKECRKWYAKISVDGHQQNLGLFTSKEDAALAYRLAAEKHHGDFARWTEEN